ncbi:MAG: glycogen-binding domain-containing protein [Phycisphaerae bacterium]
MVEQGRKRGTFRFSIAPGNGAKKVCLAGDFNDWQPQRLRKRPGGEFVAIVPLEPGTYEYKFVVDGEWTVDPDTSAWAANEFGTFNSVLRVESK